jgi:predicted RNA-binding protein YlxR (DUF448 family)
VKAVADPRAVLPGRGAYLCRAAASEGPAEGCLALAIRRGGIARGLRRAVLLDSLAAEPELVESVSR